MDLTCLGFDQPEFTQPETVRLTNVTAPTLDNWLRYDHARSERDRPGRRVFTFAQQAEVDATEMMVSLFKMPPALASMFARRAVEQYRPAFEGDKLEIASGADWRAARRDLDAQFTFARDGGEVVEVDPAERPDAIMMVLPIRMIARRLLAAIKAMD